MFAKPFGIPIALFLYFLVRDVQIGAIIIGFAARACALKSTTNGSSKRIRASMIQKTTCTMVIVEFAQLHLGQIILVEVFARAVGFFAAPVGPVLAHHRAAEFDMKILAHVGIIVRVGIWAALEKTLVAQKCFAYVGLDVWAHCNASAQSAKKKPTRTADTKGIVQLATLIFF